MPKLISIKDYITKHGETEKVTTENTILNFDGFTPASRLEDIRIRNTLSDLEAFQQLFGIKHNKMDREMPKSWFGIYLDKYDFSILIKNEQHFLTDINPETIKEELLRIFNDNEDKIFSLFNLPEHIRNNIIKWNVIVPEEEKGWLRLCYTYETAQGLIMSGLKY